MIILNLKEKKLFSIRIVLFQTKSGRVSLYSLLMPDAQDAL
jgi:hypothetical protein